MKTPKNPNISPMQMMHNNAMRRIMSDRELRVWLFALITEDCFVGCFDPIGQRGMEIAVLQRLGNLLLRDMKEINLKATHRAEIEYRALLEDNQTWHDLEETNPFGEERVDNG